MIARYQAAKDRRGLLDYDDLIDKALDAARRGRAPPGCTTSSTSGIDHVLIDEAQDTSPEQWQIIRALTAEFFAGAGARDVNRTIFAVGDEKQSIFSFQGAAPREFDAMRRDFARRCASDRARAALRAVPPFVPLRARTCSARVDEVFGRPEAFAGLSADAGARPCTNRCPARRPGWSRSGRRIKPRTSARSKPGTRRSTRSTETSPQVRLARRRSRATSSAGSTQGARAGDVLVLVRQRGAAVRGDHPRAQGRAHRGRRRRPAGADRAYRGDGPDGAGATRCCCRPTISRSRPCSRAPLFGLRRRRAVRDRLGAPGIAARGACGRRRTCSRASRKRQTSSTALPNGRGATRRSASMRACSGPERGRRQFLARLGHEADDALDEFLNLALDYERRETPSLQGFIAWLRAAQHRRRNATWRSPATRCG